MVENMKTELKEIGPNEYILTLTPETEEEREKLIQCHPNLRDGRTPKFITPLELEDIEIIE